MKKITVILLGIIFTVVILPSMITLMFTSSPSPKVEEIKEVKNLKVYDHVEKKIKEMNIEDYLVGVVAKEMPVEFQEEAIKAQVVAARTYTLKRMKSNGGGGTKYSSEADISTDPAECQAWASEEEMKKKWKEKFEQNRKKIEDAVHATTGQILVYKDEIITALFHSTSGGRTENAADIFGSEFPYLRSVESPGEDKTPKYLAVKEIDEKEVRKILKDKFPTLVLNEKTPLLQQLKNEVRGDGGRIKKVEVGNVTLKGEELRFALGLNSSNIAFEQHGAKIKIITKGYGHGVGMSQYGANVMAAQQKNYTQILTHYYQGAKIINEKDLR